MMRMMIVGGLLVGVALAMIPAATAGTCVTRDNVCVGEASYDEQCFIYNVAGHGAVCGQGYPLYTLCAVDNLACFSVAGPGGPGSGCAGGVGVTAGSMVYILCND